MKNQSPQLPQYPSPTDKSSVSAQFALTNTNTHSHSGAAMDGGRISYNNLLDTPASVPTVDSFNTRTGAVVLANADVLAASDTIQTYTPGAGGTATIDLSLSNVNHISMPAGNITIALSNGTLGQCFIIRILQDSGGSRTVTWFANIKWAYGGTAPTLTTTANKADTFGFEVTGLSMGIYTDGFVVGQNI